MADSIGELGVILIGAITIAMLLALFCNGNLLFFENKMVIKVIDKYSDDITGKNYVAISKSLAHNVTYEVNIESVYKTLEEGKIYYVSYDKQQNTILDTYVCKGFAHDCKWTANLGVTNETVNSTNY